MVISHKYRYLFVELPFTATKAISKELKLHYNGIPILHKHATYEEFKRSDWKKYDSYFVFANIRNPLDEAVSHYFKIKNTKDGSGPLTRKNKKISGRFFYYLKKRKYHFIHKNNADFSTFFLKYYKWPYNNWSCLSHHKFNTVLRFENLSEGFSSALKMMSIIEKRPLPVLFKTPEREKEFYQYYSPDAIERAKRVFGPFMKKWDYSYPPSWGDMEISGIVTAQYQVLNIFKKFYWIYVRPHVFPTTNRWPKVDQGYEK